MEWDASWGPGQGDSGEMGGRDFPIEDGELLASCF
jgi:hypothetical protein